MTSLICVALAVYFEARSEPIVAQELVAHAVIMRTLDERYPAHACEVVFEERQFAWARDSVSPPVRNATAWSTAKSVAERALNDDTTYLITHFHDTSETPFWAASFDQVTQVGSIVFYFNDTPYR